MTLQTPPLHPLFSKSEYMNIYFNQIRCYVSKFVFTIFLQLRRFSLNIKLTLILKLNYCTKILFTLIDLGKTFTSHYPSDFRTVCYIILYNISVLSIGIILTILFNYHILTFGFLKVYILL